LGRVQGRRRADPPDPVVVRSLEPAVAVAAAEGEEAAGELGREQSFEPGEDRRWCFLDEVFV
jgi:hypothetical protein